MKREKKHLPKLSIREKNIHHNQDTNWHVDILCFTQSKFVKPKAITSYNFELLQFQWNKYEKDALFG